MPKCFEPRRTALPAAQQEMWPHLAPAAGAGFVLYGGTAIALWLGHRLSVDFDFFRSEPLDKGALRAAFAVLGGAAILQDEIDTLVVSVSMPSGPVKLSLFGGIGFGRVNDPVQTSDGVLLVASVEDLLATKLKAILDRAEARDYRDIAAMLRAGASLERGLGAFRAMFDGEPATVLRALGWFEDGNLRSLATSDKDALVAARDRVRNVPAVRIARGSLAVPTGPCDEIVPGQG